jgi:hypothetical protein
MRLWVALLIFSSVSVFAQSTDHLSTEEIKAAIDAKPGVGSVAIIDESMAASDCVTQAPSEVIYTPTGWLNALSVDARRQFLSFAPKPEDTGRNLTIISRGCVKGQTSYGPACASITRVVLLSDKAGTLKAEAALETPLSQVWQNVFGASAECSSLVSRFLMSDVQKVRNAKGEFLIATFNGAYLLKMYTVKQKHIKQLGM